MKGHVHLNSAGQYLAFELKDKCTTCSTVVIPTSNTVLNESMEELFAEEIARFSVARIPAESYTIVTIGGGKSDGSPDSPTP